MTSTVHLDGGFVAASLVAYLFAIAYPVVLAVVARRRLAVRWRYFWFGVIIFGIVQVLTRIPAITVIQAVFGNSIQASPFLLWDWLAVLVLTAALFEEVGRYVGYRVFMGREEKTWNKGVMYGLGHGGLESSFIVGFAGLYGLLQLVVIAVNGLQIIPPAQRPQVAHQFQAIAALPGWFPLLAAWERLWTLPVQVALSIIVLQVFRRGSIGWLGLAILAHVAVDGVTVGAQQLLGGSVLTRDLIVEGIVAVFGIAAIWVIVALRDQPAQSAPSAPQAPPEPAQSLSE